MNLLRVQNLSAAYSRGYHDIPALRGLSFSGQGGVPCGCRRVRQRQKYSRQGGHGHFGKNALVSSGAILFQGEDLLSMKRTERRKLMGRDIAMVFQTP